MDIMNLNNLFLTTARGDLLQSQDQIILRNMVHLSLLKCGKVEMENMIDQGDLSKILGIHWKKLILIVENMFSAGPRILQGTKRLFTIERGDPIQRIFKEMLILKISSWEVRYQNLSIKSETKCESDRKECRALQRMYRTFNNMGNVYGYNIECSGIYGKEYFNHAECCEESRKFYIETDV